MLGGKYHWTPERCRINCPHLCSSPEAEVPGRSGPVRVAPASRRGCPGRLPGPRPGDCRCGGGRTRPRPSRAEAVGNLSHAGRRSGSIAVRPRASWTRAIPRSPGRRCSDPLNRPGHVYRKRLGEPTTTSNLDESGESDVARRRARLREGGPFTVLSAAGGLRPGIDALSLPTFIGSFVRFRLPAQACRVSASLARW